MRDKRRGRGRKSRGGEGKFIQARARHKERRPVPNPSFRRRRHCRREEPTEFEQVEDVVEDLVHTVEYELTEEKIIAEYDSEVLKRSVWHPATISFFMKDLPQGGQGNRDLHVEARKLVTDMAFLESKVTMGGEVVNWHPLAKKPYKTKGQSLWAKMTNAEGATKAFGNLAKRMTRTSEKSGSGQGFSLSAIGKAALGEIQKEEEERKKELEEAIIGMTTADDDNAKEETGVKPQPAAMKLVSALKSSIRGSMTGLPTTSKSGAAKDGDKEAVKTPGQKKKTMFKMPKIPWSEKKKDEKKTEVKIETPDEVRERERSERRSRRTRGSRGSRNSRDSKDSVDTNAEDKGEEEKEESAEKKMDSDDEAEKKKKKERGGILSKIKNPFKRVKTPEEIEEEERKAKALVYGEDHKDANEIVRKAKEEKARQERPWEHARENPVEVARVHFTIASHAPKLISERTVKEKQEDGTSTSRIVIDGEKRKKWERKLVKELAFIAGVPIKHVTIDEVTNRDTDQGYFQGKTWIIGTEGEFKSVQEKYIEVEEKKQEERERARSSSFANELKKRAENMNFPSLVVSPKNMKGSNDKGSAEAAPHSDSPTLELKLPDITKKAPSGADASGTKTEKEGKKQAAPHSKKRDFIKAMGKHNTQGVGSRWGADDTDGSEVKKKRKASNAQGVMDARLEELMKNTERTVKKKREKAMVEYDKSDAYDDKRKEDKKKKKTSTDAKELKDKLVARCLPSLADEEGGSLLSALKFKGSDHARCNIVVTFTSSLYVKALSSAVRVTKATTEGIGLPPNSLMSTCVKCKPDAFGERKFFDEWEHYWVNFISPVFFGYSTRKRFKERTKHKVHLGAPKVKVEKTRRMILEADFDRACAEYKKR